MRHLHGHTLFALFGQFRHGVSMIIWEFYLNFWESGDLYGNLGVPVSGMSRLVIKYVICIHESNDMVNQEAK